MWGKYESYDSASKEHVPNSQNLQSEDKTS